MVTQSPQSMIDLYPWSCCRECVAFTSGAFSPRVQGLPWGPQLLARPGHGVCVWGVTAAVVKLFRCTVSEFQPELLSL